MKKLIALLEESYDIKQGNHGDRLDIDRDNRKLMLERVSPGVFQLTLSDRASGPKALSIRLDEDEAYMLAQFINNKNRRKVVEDITKIQSTPTLERDKYGGLQGRIDPPLKISGDGSSIWGESLGTFTVNRFLLIPLAEDSDVADDEGLEKEQPSQNFYQVELYGPNTEWEHYTDGQIEREVNEKFLPWLAKTHQIYIKEASWSEQGAQPDGGWNFDVF